MMKDLVEAVSSEGGDREALDWQEAIASVIAFEGGSRADELLGKAVETARLQGARLPFAANTAYFNTIPPNLEAPHPGDRELEYRIRSVIRWNALAMVLKANKKSSELGGHLSSYQSAATLYETGFSHFWCAPSDDHGGDLIFFQGHSSPGIYARAFLEGRLTEEQLTNFRSEADGDGLSSYPHPWLMPEFWQFPTVSMGLGPIMAIYHARFLKYLHDRGLVDTSGRKVWVFCGDGEMDEPESLGAISLAGTKRANGVRTRPCPETEPPRLAETPISALTWTSTRPDGNGFARTWQAQTTSSHRMRRRISQSIEDQRHVLRAHRDDSQSHLACVIPISNNEQRAD